MALFSAAVASAVHPPALGASDAQPDYAREVRLAEQISDGILDGDVVQLTAGGRSFMSIYTESESTEARGTVILMHGRGMHPDWADVINPLRVGLTERGWHTLSVQMPVLAKGAKYYAYVPIFDASFARIDAAIAYARQQSAGHVVLLAHSCSVHMVMAHVRDAGDSQFDAFVGIGMGATDYKQPMRQPFPLAQMRVPVFDVSGADEFPAVKRGAPRRLAAMRSAGHVSSAQQIVPDADHYFKDAGAPLLDAVSAWLDSIRWESK